MKIILNALVVAVAFSAHADYLYWQILQDPDSEDSVPFTYAKIAVKGEGIADGTYLTLSGTDGETDVLHSSFNFESPAPGYSTLETYSNLSRYGLTDASVLSFVAELYSLADGGDHLVGVSPTIAYDMLKFADYTDMNQSRMPFVFNSFSAVPEPSNALLMLLGFAMLSLRRRRVCACVAAAAVGMAATAMPNDTLLSFGTSGTDRYADGTRVLDGECYAVVWTKEGASFAGLTDKAETIADTDRLVLAAPVAQGGRCPQTVLEISADMMSSYEGGSFGLYLLDTRVRGEDGSISLAAQKGGVPETVNSIGAAAEAGASPADFVGNEICSATPVSLGTVGVHTQIASPRITAIRVEGANVTLKVEGMSPVADYFVVPAAKAGEAAQVIDAKLENGEFTFPRTEGGSMYKVVGAHRF